MAYYTDAEVNAAIAAFEKQYTEFLHNEFGDDPDKFWAGLDEAGRKQVWAQWCYGGKAVTFRELQNLWCEQFPIPREARQIVSGLLERYVWLHPEFVKTNNEMHALRQELQKQIFVNGELFIANRTSKVDDFSVNVDISHHFAVNPYANPLMYWFDDYLIVESVPAKVRAFDVQVWDTSKPDAFGDYHKIDIFVQRVEKGDPAFAAIVETYDGAINALAEEQKRFKQLVG